MPAVLRSILFTAILLVPAFAGAQTDDAVVVLEYGGVESLHVVDLDTTGAAPATVDLGRRRVVPEPLGPVSITDVKILPDGSHLLSDVDGRGYAVTRPDGQFRLVFDEEQRLDQTAAASAAGYFAEGQPSQILMVDDAASMVSIRDASSDRTLWFQSLRLSSARPSFVQSVVLPNNRVAVAANWSTIGLSAVDVYDVTQPVPEPTRLASATHLESPDDLTIVEELDTIRDLMGLDDGTLLVTTRFAVVNMSETGEVVWSLSIGDDPTFGGEFSSARMLPSGNIGVATFQPGAWIDPHENHRIHWIDPETGERLVSAGPLEKGPRRVEPLAGHGGTGTSGFTAGLDEIQQGDVSTVELVSLSLGGTKLPVAEDATVRAIVENGGTFAVAIAELVIRAGASDGDCEDPVRDFDLARGASIALQPGATYSLFNRPRIERSYPTGEYCAFVEAKDTGGQWHPVGSALAFEIVEEQDDDNPVEMDDLPFEGADAGDPEPDAGTDADGGPAEEFVPKRGCCATADEPTPPHSALLAFGIVVLVSARRLSARGRAPR